MRIRDSIQKLFHALTIKMAKGNRTAKRFAPLDPKIGNSTGAPLLKGIVFDVDGTLWYVAERPFTEMLHQGYIRITFGLEVESGVFFFGYVFVSPGFCVEFD
jgi:hypothetical protein